MRKTWPTLLVSWYLVISRLVIGWANSKLFYAYIILLHLIYTNGLLLVVLQMALAGYYNLSLRVWLKEETNIVEHKRT